MNPTKLSPGTYFTVRHQKFDEEREDDHGWRFFPVCRTLASFAEVVEYISKMTSRDRQFEVKVGKFEVKALRLTDEEKERLPATVKT
jgi:hypothetical protein